MQSNPLTKHQLWGSVSFCLIIFVAFLWGVQGFVLATTTSTDSSVADTTPPDAPFNMAVSDVTPTHVALSWSIPSDNVAVTRYELKYKIGGGTFSENDWASAPLLQAVGGPPAGVLGITTFGYNELTPNTTYILGIKAYDAAGNASSLAVSPSFTTTGLPSTTTSTLAISSISGTSSRGITVITWMTNVPADSTVEHGSSLSLGYTTYGAPLVTSHTITLPVGLTYGIPYYYKVKSRDSAGNIVASEVQTLLIPVPAIPCVDSDGGSNFNTLGTVTGIYAGGAIDYHAIFGQNPNPTTPKSTTNNYSTYIDHCSWDPTQLNEGFCDSMGRISSVGVNCGTYGCSAGVCNSATASSTAQTPGAGAPEPSNNEPGVWAQVDVATGQVVGSAICTKSVCGLNGEWHGYVPPASYQTGSVWWPTSKRYIWQIQGQAGYGSGTFNFQTYVFTVSGGMINNGIFTPTPTPSSPSDSSLVGYWKFDGNGNNDVAGNPSAVIVGKAEFNSSGGKMGGFLYIPTAVDWAKIPYSSVYDLPNDFTIEFWFRQRANQSFNQNLVYKGTPPNNFNFNISRWLWNEYNFGPVIAGHTAANTGYWTQPSNPNQLAHNLWHHVVFTKSPNYHAYYLDGALTGSKDITSSYNSEYGGPAKTPHNDIIIGDTAVDTDIDNLKIYNRALSATEVAEIGGFPPPSPSPTPPPPPPPSPTTTSTPASSLPGALSPYPTSTQIFPYQLVPMTTSTPLVFIPTATSAPILPSPFLEVICADGSRMPSGASCPALVVFICANGEKVRSPHECIPSKLPEDAITLCVNHGGMWCADQCAPRGSICGGVGESGGAKVVIDVAQVKEFEAQKRELIREIRLAERALRQAKQNPDVAEASRLKDQLEDVKLREPGALQDLAVLQQAAEKLNEKAEAARERRLQDPGAAEADARTKEKNLRGIKQQIRPFERHVVTLEGRVKEFEKAGVAVDPPVKAALAEARAIAQKIKVAKNYDAADEAVEDMLDVAATLNDLGPAMESAARVLEIARLLERQIVTADRALAQTIKLAKRLKIDSAEDINEMRALLEQAKVAVAAIKTSGIDKELLSEYAETQVIDAVDEIVEIADHFRVITNARRHVAKVTADFKQYDSRIRREERKKKDMTSVRALVDEGREHLAGLQKLVTSRLTVENAEAMLELMRSINDVKEELDELLGIAKPSAIERDLERVIESGGAKVKSYNVDAVEKLLI